MGQIILDLSANTFKNDKDYVRKMIDEIYKIDNKIHAIIFKTQLFEKAGENIPLEYDVFEYMYKYANSFGYKVTSSVFDLHSLQFLLHYSVPFIKIANNRDLDWLVGHIPRKIPFYMSHTNNNPKYDNNAVYLACISKYPATMQDYEENFKDKNLEFAISDHTTNWDLYNYYTPMIYECHYKLSDSTGLDAGEFARTPEQLAEIL